MPKKFTAASVFVCVAAIVLFFLFWDRGREVIGGMITEDGHISQSTIFPPLALVQTVGVDATALHTALSLLGYTFVSPAKVNSTCLLPHTYSHVMGEAFEGRCGDARVIVPTRGGKEIRDGLGSGEMRVLRMDVDRRGGKKKWEELVEFLGVGYSVLERLKVREWPRGQVGRREEMWEWFEKKGL
jgi:hypothetical protein